MTIGLPEPLIPQFMGHLFSHGDIAFDCKIEIMLDLSYLRDRVNELREALEKRNYDTEILEKLLEIDRRRRELIKKTDELRALKNEKSRLIGKIKREGGSIEEILSELKKIDEELEKLEEERKKVEEEFWYLWSLIPNIPHESVPVGPDESANVEVRRWGEVPRFDFEPLAHWDLGERLGILDIKKGGELAGSRFVVYKNLGARLEWALINYFRDKAVQNRYTEILPPFLVNERTMYNSGQLPKFREEMYYIEKDGLYLVPTAEVPLTSLHANEILDEEQLPLYYFAYTPCFRREAGAHGRDVRGIKRMHQFNKVELYKYALPENSYNELEKMVRDVEGILQELNIPYRVVLLSTGDMGFAAAKTYDIEVWAAGQNAWLEASSISNVEAFQARRANIKVRRKTGKKEFVHTLNGSGLATPRVLIAILENNQQKDGSIIIPEVLRPYVGEEVIKP